MGQILIGTCSWTDKSLIECGRFYPPWVRTPEDFVFHIKAFALFTGHAAEVRSLPREFQDTLSERGLEKRRVYVKDLPENLQEEVWQRFADALLPLQEAGKLGVVLFQYPPWFHPGAENRQYILKCREHLAQILSCPLAVEFRNSGWLNDRNQNRTLSFLEKKELVFVSVDEPQVFPSSVPPIAKATIDMAYVRFHGRNRDTWEKRGAVASERFNYYYSDEELKEWVLEVKTLQEATSTTHVLFNTNYQDQGVVNARKLAMLLRET